MSRFKTIDEVVDYYSINFKGKDSTIENEIYYICNKSTEILLETLESTSNIPSIHDLLFIETISGILHDEDFMYFRGQKSLLISALEIYKNRKVS